jgi:hypothetical protein
MCNHKYLQDTRAAIASHHGTRRPTPTPASCPQRIAAHRTTSIKSSHMKASQHTAGYRSRCASDPQTRDNHTAHRYLTPSSHSTTQRHCDGRARHNATHSDAIHVQTSARHNKDTATANSERMSRVTHMQNCNTTTFDSQDVEYTHSRAHHGCRHTHTHAGTASEGGGNATKMHEQPDVS